MGPAPARVWRRVERYLDPPERRRLEVQVLGFDKEVRPLEQQSGVWQLPETADGGQTAIGFALEEVLRRESGKRLIGMVLLGDGTGNFRTRRVRF